MPGKPRVWTPLVIWMAAVIMGQFGVLFSFIAVGIGMGIVMGVQGVDPATIQLRVQAAVQQPVPALLLSLVPFQLGMALVVLLAAWRSPEPLKVRLGLLPAAGRTFATISLAMMACFTLSTGLASVVGSTLLMGEPAVNPIGAALDQGSTWTIALLGVLLSTVPAIVEEIVFRGYIQRRLLARWSPAWAIAVSTLLFALIHADSLQHIFAVVPLGLVTGILAWRTGSVKPGMLLHALHNASAVAFATAASSLELQLGEEGVGMLMLAAIATLCVIGLPATLSLLRRTPIEPAPASHAMPLPAESLAAQPA